MGWTEYDLTTFTEVDTPGWITSITATRVNWVDMDNNADAYLFLDLDPDSFDGDFSFRFINQMYNARDDWSRAGVWGVSDTVDDAVHWANGIVLKAHYHPTNNQYYYFLQLWENGVEVVYVDGGAVIPSTSYYITVARDDTGGVNGTGQTTATIRTDSHTGSVVYTLSVDSSVGEQNDYRYLYAVVSDDGGSANRDIDGYTDTLELLTGWTGKINGITNPAKINGIAVANIKKVCGIE